MAGTDCCYCNYSRLAVGAVAGSNLLAAAAAAAAQEGVVALAEIKCVSKLARRCECILMQGCLLNATPLVWRREA